MSRRTIVILIAVALVVAIVAFAIWFANRSSAQGAIVAAAEQRGRNPQEFRAGRDIAGARELHRSLAGEIEALHATGGVGNARWNEVHRQLGALERLYPELRR